MNMQREPRPAPGVSRPNKRREQPQDGGDPGRAGDGALGFTAQCGQEEDAEIGPPVCMPVRKQPGGDKNHWKVHKTTPGIVHGPSEHSGKALLTQEASSGSPRKKLPDWASIKGCPGPAQQV